LQLFYERAVEMKLAPPGRSLELDAHCSAARYATDASSVGYLGNGAVSGGDAGDAASVGKRVGHQLSQSPVPSH
jgi:hypothetical protein